MGGCQNYGPFLGTLNRDPKRDHNFDNHPYTPYSICLRGTKEFWVEGGVDGFPCLFG